ncbi:hypothetical protein [Streptomyces sp. 184]|uniref:hypothetical protein n=1 Tax=Streptomyces sp. 184 TaxID=1827526 RepID=UPI003891AF8E
MLHRLAATARPGVVTLVVVTSALRAEVEHAGDHEHGLARVRASLARIGARGGDGWVASYYGKELVLVRPGWCDPPSPGLAAGGRVRHGWAWGRVVVPGARDTAFEELLLACYVVSMAARLRRDHGGLPARAPEALAAVPGLLTARATASLLAGVLVRPYGAKAGDEGDDPRMPGVPSADGWSARPGAAGRWLVMTDVHDIEWGTVRPDAGGHRLTAGNAQEVTGLAEQWHQGRDAKEVLPAAYRLRCRRERELVDHLRDLAHGVRGHGTLYGTFGDGLCGYVDSPDALRGAVARANRAAAGRLASGAGIVYVPYGDGDVAAVRRRCAFALHVTKTLKGTGLPPDGVQEFGRPLAAPAADAALAFLEKLKTAGTGAPGGHHLDHARRHRAHWLTHLPPPHRPRATELLDRGDP